MAEQRWRYEDHNSRIMWLRFDPGFLCIWCDQPVSHLSMGGPAMCPSCDCGCHANGTQWSSSDFYRMAKNAKHRLIELPDDPAWAEYERAHAETKADAALMGR